jgi:hypothetical protein
MSERDRDGLFNTDVQITLIYYVKHSLHAFVRGFLENALDQDR